MKKLHKGRKLVTGIMMMSLTFAMLTGCSNGLSKDKLPSGSMTQEEASGTKAMVIGDYDINMDELLFYALQYLTTNKGTEDAVKADPDTFKDGTLSLIRTTKILYDVSQHNDVTLDEDDMENVNSTIDNFKSSVPAEILEKYGISDEVIERAFKEQACASKFENDIRNDMGKTATQDIKDKCKDYNFMVLEYIVFPIVETNENDEPATDTDGEYISLSDDEKESIHKKAEEMAKKLNDGGDIDELLTQYEVDKYSQEMSGYVGAFSDNMNKQLENMSAGECSEITENSVGYIMLYVKTDHDEDLLDSYAYALASDTVEDQFNNLETQWLSSIEVDPDKDMEGTVWADYNLADLAADLEKNDLIR